MSKYQYQDISELRSRILAEIEQYFNCRNDTILRDTASFQEEQYSDCLNSILSLVEYETK
jgi:hypothetical protein